MITQAELIAFQAELEALRTQVFLTAAAEIAILLFLILLTIELWNRSTP